ncbi:hypothetical protein [Porphyrobacter sp. GA68]|uniref:hypothetical protein n=1 Tax=Porphyrobacter sp. GA68 TaxID=2883480 RepID=UPI001D18F3E3|nr:hypothetical protein [Porphyrobacter sp. GA68]
MRPRLFVSVLALCAAACGQSGEREGAVPQALELEAITFADIEREDMFGAGCSFAPAGGGIAALAIAQSDAGYLKIAGEVVRFTPDTTSDELPLGARERYAGSSMTFQLLVRQEEASPSGYETVNYPGRLIVQDRAATVRYDSAGTVQCGA